MFLKGFVIRSIYAQIEVKKEEEEDRKKTNNIFLLPASCLLSMVISLR